MPTLPSPRTVLRAHPRLLAAAVAAAVAVGAVTAAASDGGDDQPASAPGPTAMAATRDLVTTLEVTGAVERVDQRTITYAAALPAPKSPSRPEAVTPASTSPTAEAPAVATTTTSSAPPNVEGPTTSTTSTTSPPRSTTPTAPPTTASTAPAATDNSSDSDQATPAPNTGQEDEDDVAATLTGILAVGSDATRGAVLYTADDEPTVALFGTIPMWRTLEDEVDPGADIRQLEENLVALGYGAGVTVDNTFSASTANAVKRWETALGRSEVDGTVDVGDVVYLAGRGAVLSHEASAGEPLDRGTTILTVASQERVVAANVPAEESAAWAPGTSVDLAWADGTHTTATVSAVSTDVIDETVELAVALPEAHSERPNGAEVTITAVGVRRGDVIAVPVSAIVTGTGGGRAVRIPGPSGDQLTAVGTGLIADGWIEITSGLEAGDAVRLPG